MPSSKEKERQQHNEWAEMQRQGHFRYVLGFILTTIGAMAAVQVVFYVLGRFFGWNAPLETMVDTVGIGCIAGFVMAETHWFDMKRKFRIPPPEEDWMAR